MDILRTDALIARLKRDGWDITPNAYKHEFAGIYVLAGTETGTVFVDKGAPQINLDIARRMAAHLETVPGIENVVVDPQTRGGDITVRFHCAQYTGNWARG